MPDIAQLKRIVEAALLASAQPLTIPQLMALFVEQETPGHDDVARALEALAIDCADRGIELVEVASGFRYQVRQDVQPWVARLWTERPTRYSRALLETLSLIAYRQPITRGEIEQIRGVAVSSNIVKTLEEREWIRVVGYRDVPGKPELFGTTRHFLDYFNLKSLDELPPLAEIRDVDDLDPQLALAPISSDESGIVRDEPATGGGAAGAANDDHAASAANDALDGDDAGPARMAGAAPAGPGADADNPNDNTQAPPIDASAPEPIT